MHTFLNVGTYSGNYKCTTNFDLFLFHVSMFVW